MLIVFGLLGCASLECGDGTYEENNTCYGVLGNGTSTDDDDDDETTNDTGEENNSDCALTEVDGPDLVDFAPVVISTCPPAGATNVDPGLKQIEIAFSKDMMDGSWSWVQYDTNFPEVTEVYFVSERVHVGLVELEADQTYNLWLNFSPDFMGFMDRDGNRAVPYQLTFQTAPAN